MRLSALILTVLAGIAGFGCKPEPVDLQLPRFKKQVRLYFNNLNNEAHARREELRRGQTAAQVNPTLLPPTGTVFNTYSHEDAGFVVENYPCRTCATRLALAVPEADYLCRACGHSPYEAHPAGSNLKESPCKICVGADSDPKAPRTDLLARESSLWKMEGVSVRDMFELTQDNPEKPLRAKVRYIRRLWTYDALGTVQVPLKAMEKSGSDPIFVPAPGAALDPADPKSVYSQAGYHRLDSTYLGEIEFEFKGGSIRALSAPVEVPIRPWKDLSRKS